MSQYHKESVLDLAWRYKYRLVLSVVGISFVSFTALYLLGLVPDEIKVPFADSDSQPTKIVPVKIESQAVVDYPTKLIIKKIGIDTKVSNPTSSDNDVLNAQLLKGAVRYPGSGTLGKGNMFIFGHSTGIKVVNNQAYKAMNNLKNLVSGDEIKITSNTREYTYKVVSMNLVNSDEALVDFNRKGNMVTLSTCNVFGEKQERYVVEAIFDSVKNL